MATVRLGKWGNSVGLRLPKHVIDHLGIEAGSFLNITLDDDGVCFCPVNTFTLEGLVSAITDENRHGETDWGMDAGFRARTGRQNQTGSSALTL